MKGREHLLGRSWTAVVLATVVSIFLLASGTIDDGTHRVAGAAPELASAALGPELISWLADSQGPFDSSERPFPILPIVGGALIAMTVALHLAAWRLAR